MWPLLPRPDAITVFGFGPGTRLPQCPPAHGFHRNQDLQLRWGLEESDAREKFLFTLPLVVDEDGQRCHFSVSQFQWRLLGSAASTWGLCSRVM